MLETNSLFISTNNLCFINFKSTNFNSLTERFNLFYNASICIIPHGGAAFHIYACKPNTKIIEFVSSNGTPICDVGKLAPYLNLDYNIMLVDGYHTGIGYNIEIQKLDDMLKCCNTTKIIRNNNYFSDY